MTWPYNPSLPNPPDDPADDVAGMQTNASSIASLINIDHVPFNTAGGGQHKQVTFNSNNVPSVFPVSPPIEFTNTIAGGNNGLFFYSGTAVQSANQYVLGTNGSTMVLGGIIIKWGTATIPNGASLIVATFASDFPNNVFSVTCVCTASSFVGDLQIRCDHLGLSSVQINRQGTPATFATYNYIVIGN